MHPPMPAFLTAAEAFVRLVDDDATAAAWEAVSACPPYTVGGMVAHTTAGLSWLATVAAAPTPTDHPRVVPASGYFRGMRITPGADLHEMHGTLVEDGNRRAERGVAAAREHLASVVAELHDLVAEADPERLVDLRPVLPFAMTLGDFVRSRIIELVVHGDDVAVSLDLDPPEPGADAHAEVLSTLLGTAQAEHGTLAVVRALTRRERAGGVLPVL